MPRPSKPIKRSILESRNAKITKNERDSENTKFEASEAVSSRDEKINDGPVFNLVLTPDILNDLENSSLERKLILSTKFNSGRSSPPIEISSSSGDEEFFYHLSSSREVGRSFPAKALSSSEDNKKSLLGENSSLTNSNELSQGQNLSTPKRHKRKVFLIKQKPKKEIETNSEDNDSDPFGFRKAEKRNMERKGQNKFDKISDGSEKFEVTTTINKYSQYIDNVQSEMISQSISLNKENDVNGSGDLCEIDKKDWKRSQENKEYNTSIENRKDDNQVDNDNNQPIHDEDHLSTDIDKESLEVTPLKTTRDKNKKEEKKLPNATPSKLRKISNITKTADLVTLLPSRRRQRASKNKINDYSNTQSDDGGEVVSLCEEENSNYKKTQKRKLQELLKMQNEKSEKKKTRRIKKGPFTCEPKEIDEKIKQEHTKRIRHTEEIDSFVLVEEIVY
ncbi:unnamed protein product [Rhizophagus irregularis]|uniref:Uncharacterized protein n=1 Tax=Rhizophagus irregularis TaxID=588596 RepID=A0A2I1HHR0_9GLOM|nr:hypothetical protein RhiirA4_550045 [Rhizophagus irregularis]CAB4415119.1 unnamed protein product [Rhizophagus irregularis]